MTVKLQCYRCNLGWQSTDANLITMGQHCPICGYWNGYKEALGRIYGFVVKDATQRVLQALEKQSGRKDADIRPAIANAEAQILEAINLAEQQAAVI